MSRMLWLRALAFFGFQTLAVGIVPYALRSLGPRLPLGGLRFGGIAFLAFGITLIVLSDIGFVRHGRGTPAPFDPPTALVVRGFYRSVRNPMYVGATTVVVGIALLTQSTIVLAYAIAVALGCHGLLLLVEEPRLLQRFGPQYAEYCRLVPRWIPRWPPHPSRQPDEEL